MQPVAMSSAALLTVLACASGALARVATAQEFFRVRDEPKCPAQCARLVSDFKIERDANGNSIVGLSAASVDARHLFFAHGGALGEVHALDLTTKALSKVWVTPKLATVGVGFVSDIRVLPTHQLLIANPLLRRLFVTDLGLSKTQNIEIPFGPRRVLPIGDSMYVVAGSYRTEVSAGQPLHFVDASGNVKASFGVNRPGFTGDSKV